MAKRSRRTNFEKNPWTVKKSRDVYDNPWIHVREDRVITPAGTPGIYGVINFKNIAIGVLALDQDKKGRDCVWLVGQYRYALDRYSWEIPEGGCPKGESPLIAGKRELREETGLRARRWKKAFEMDLSNSVTDERAVIFIARDLTGGASQPEETEELRVKKMPLARAIDLVLKGEITDAISVAALLYAKSFVEEAKP